MILVKVPAEESKTILRQWIRTTIDERQKIKVLHHFFLSLFIGKYVVQPLVRYKFILKTIHFMLSLGFERGP